MIGYLAFAHALYTVLGMVRPLAASTPEDILKRLAPAQQRTVRACLLAGMTTAAPVQEGQVAAQMSAEDVGRTGQLLEELAAWAQPLVNPRGADWWGFTGDGARVARALQTRATETVEGELVTPPGRRVRGSPRAEMEAYAKEVGGTYYKAGNAERCTMCGHDDSRFVKLGRKLLCQTCWQRDIRFD